jgi:hypothetical protein
MEVMGNATFKEAVLFERNVQYNGDVNVLGYTNVQSLTVNLDLIVKGAMEIDGPATFKEVVKFEKDAEFDGRVAFKGQTTFNDDTAGNATIKQGDTTVDVTFKAPKDRVPIIVVSLGDGKFAQYSYKDVNEDGFQIILSEPASEDLSFSWAAIQTEQKPEQADMP